jgi:acetyl esterase
LPVIVYLHGGGWTFGSIDTHDGVMRCLALESGCAVLGVDYRLAPEHPFPAPLDDALAALAHVEAGGLGAGCDRARVALAGDSAGATIALGALIARRDAGGSLPVTAALFYGCYAPVFDTPSHLANGDGAYLLRTEMMRWYWANYLGARAPQQAPAACAPLVADLSGLPPLYLNAAGLDPLLDDTTLIAARLAAAGVRLRLDVFAGVVHGFLRFARDLPAAREALAAAGAWLGHELVDDERGRMTT